MSEQSNIYRYEKARILDEMVELIQDRSDWNGFRNRLEIAERFENGEVSWIHSGGRVVCAATYRHRKHSHSRVYVTGMSDDNWHPESWRHMVRGIVLESPHDRVISKTPVDSSEGELWESIGTWLRESNGLDIWEVVDMSEIDRLKEW